MVKRLLVLLLFAHSLTSLALESSKVIDVDGKEITLKAPDGFHISSELSVLEFWQTALGKFSIRAAIVPNNGDDSRSMVVLTNPSSDKLNLTKNLFIDATRVLIRNQANLMESLKGEIKEFNEIASKKLKEKYGVIYKSSIDDSTKVNVFIDTDNAVSFFSILEGKLSLAGYVDNSPQVGSISYLRLKDKLIVLNMYSSYRGVDDIDWIMKKTKEVVGLLTKANKSKDINSINQSIMESIENGSADGKYGYARSLLKDLKLKDAQKWMESAAKDGHTIAQGEVGSMYITGNLLNLIPKFTESEVLKIDKTLVDFDKHKLALGVNNINNWMDNVKNTNEGFNFDLDKGTHYLDLSYKKGNHLAKISCDGLIKLLINSSEGRNKYIEKLGMMYSRGTCVEKNYDKSIVWFNKLAIRGVIKAYAYLGVTYYEKFDKYGNKEDRESALYFIKKAINSYSKSQPHNKNMMKFLIEKIDKIEEKPPLKG